MTLHLIRFTHSIIDTASSRLNSDLDDPMPSWVGVADIAILAIVLGGGLYAWNLESDGWLIRWAKRLFPREMHALGF
jgi:hypothetical protein